MSLAITSADVSVLAATLGIITPLVGSFLLVIKWIVNFQREITDKYREELKDTRKEFDDYKLAVERRMTLLERQVDELTESLAIEKQHSSKIITHIKEQGLSLPPELERRKVTR